MSRASVSSVHLVRRQVLTDRATVAVVAVVVLVTAGLAAALPRALDTMRTDGVRSTVADTGPLQRDLAVVLFSPPAADRSGTSDAPLQPLRDFLADVVGGLPPVVAEQVGDPVFSVDFRDMAVAGTEPELPSPADNAFLELTVQDAFGEHVEYVAGRPPERISLTERADSLPADPGRRLPLAFTHDGLVEVAVSDRTADALGLQLGSRVRLAEASLTLDVVGLFEPLDPSDAYWGFDTRVLRPQQNYSSILGVTYTGVAVVGEPAYPGLEALLSAARQPVTLLRLPTTAAGLESRDVPALVAALRQVEQTPVELPPPVPGVPSPGSVQLATDLEEVLTGHLRVQQASTAVVSLVVAGLLGVVIAVLALAGRLVVERRRHSLALALARGGSPGQLRGLLAVEGLVLGVPAAVGGWLLAAAAVPGWGGTWGVVLPALIGLAPAVLLPLLGAPARFGAPARLGGQRSARRGTRTVLNRRLRLAGEAVAVLAAVTTVAVLRARGLTAGTAGLDPLLAAAPLLAALAGALLLARVYPVPLRALTVALGRRRGAVAFIGAARASRDPAGGILPLVVLVLALATAVTGSVVTATTDRGARVAAAQEVGADARVSALGVDAEEAAAAADVEGVAAVAPLATAPAQLRTDRSTTDVTLVAADAAGLAAVQAGVPGAPAYPDRLWTPDPQDAGDAVPILVRDGVATPGTRLRLAVGSSTVDAVVVGTGPRDLPALRSPQPWVVADRGLLVAAGGDVPADSVLLVDLVDSLDPPDPEGGAAADGSTGAEPLAAVTEAVRAAVGTEAPVLTQAGALQRARGEPLVAGTLDAFAVSAVLAGALAALAVVLTLLITAPARGRLLSRLRTLGLSARQAQALAVWEVAPLAVAAVTAGVLLGVVVPWAVLPAVDLQAFTGGTGPPPFSVDVLAVVAIAGGVVAGVAVAVAGTVAANRRLRLGGVLRVGDDE